MRRYRRVPRSMLITDRERLGIRSTNARAFAPGSRLRHRKRRVKRWEPYKPDPSMIAAARLLVDMLDESGETVDDDILEMAYMDHPYHPPYERTRTKISTYKRPGFWYSVWAWMGRD